MITLIVLGFEGMLDEKYDNLTLRELGETLTKLSKDYVLVFDTIHNLIPQACCTMIVTKQSKRK